MSWESYDRAAEKGPWSMIWKWGLLIVGVIVVFGAIAYGLGWIGETGQVAQDEFGPKAALEKYEWFINQAAAIDKMDKDIKLYEARRADVETKYAKYGDPKSWAPSTQAQYNQESQTARDDLLSIISQRNNLVKDYNAQSGKFNWSPFETKPDRPAKSYADYPVK